MTGERLPTYFISHGGGPWPWLENFMGDWSGLEASLAAIPDELGVTPKAIVCVSAHWETPEFAVQTNAKPSMLYDYGGFPPHTYEVQYPAPGSPSTAARVRELLTDAGIASTEDPMRGFDHGTFVPMHVSYPEADVPVFQLSLRADLDPARHLAVGQALAPLRDENVLILASGFPSFHDLSTFGPPGRVPSQQFDGWLHETLVGMVGEERNARMLDWESAPAARIAHPREEHLIPMLIAVGAAEDEAGHVQFHDPDFLGWMSNSSFRFGDLPSTSKGSWVAGTAPAAA
ncbi:MAG: class III extradiol ring-cleavage dioxygenase [Actinomycetota bacterium]